MNVLVTGGLGFLGAHVSAHFADAGHRVRVLSRTPHAEQGAWQDRFEVVTADVADAASLAGACDGIELVVHAAGLNAQVAADHPALAVTVNGLGTRNVIEEAVRAGTRRIVYLSTVHVYGAVSTSLDELTAPAPTTDYGITKLLGEGYCYEALAAGRIEPMVLRPANGFAAPLFASADCWMLAVPDFCRQAFETGEIALGTAGTQQRVFMSLHDTVRAIETLAGAPAATTAQECVHTAGSGTSLSIRELARLVAEQCSEVFGRAVRVRVPAGTEALDDDPPIDYRFDRLAALGFRPQSDLRPAIREVAEFVARA